MRRIPNCVAGLLVVVAIMGTAMQAEAKVSEEELFPWDNVRNINSGWEYIEVDDISMADPNEAERKTVDLPHTWNAIDTLDPEIGIEYRRDVSWYRKHLKFSRKEKSQRVFVRFGAAGHVADIYFNGQLIGRHEGSYTAFTFELTRHILSGDNFLAVKVNNAHNEMVAPLKGDFNIYGGLYRSVHLLTAPKIHLSRSHRGGPGVRVWSPKVSRERASISVSTLIDNGSDQTAVLVVKAELRGPDGKVVTTGSKGIRSNGATVTKVDLALEEVANPALWSPETPDLYELTVRLYKNEKVVDETVVRHGFRWYEFDANNGFFLNGQPYKLRGVNRHQDFYQLGNALDMAQHLIDLEYMKEMGVNWLRLAHYPQDGFVLDLCDRLGLLVWEEIPQVGLITFDEQFYANCETQLSEMIEQHFNHPSIILWGFSNEVGLSHKENDPRINALFERLHNLIHKEDPGRLSVLACHHSDTYADFGLTSIPDVVGYNLYFGWYYDEIEDLTAGLKRLHAATPDKPIIVSEYGPGSEIPRHTTVPGRFDFSQEWQVRYHESYLDQFDKLSWLAGSNVWNMFDFGSAKRGDTVPCVNQKGLMTFDRDKKDAFYLYKARWSEEPVVYILSPTWTERTGPARKEYRVISNCDQVELFHRGKSLGVQTDEFTWEVRLEEGKNKLVAKGRKGKAKKQHSITVNYKYMPPMAKEPIRVNCGGDEYRDRSGRLWLADQTCVDVEGTWGAVSGEFGSDEELTITGIAETRLFETWRLGGDGYFFAMPPGRYKVRLGLFNPKGEKGSDGSERVFGIALQGRQVVTDWTFHSEAKSREAVWKQFDAHVAGNEGLTIRLIKGRYNHSIVCAVEILPE